jgi:enterobactin synthetase component F
MQRDMAAPIDLTRTPAAAEVLFVLDDQRHIWYQRVHHLAIDGYGTALLTDRICDLYASAVARAAPTTTPFGSLAVLLAHAEAYRASDTYERDRRFWLEAFADRPEPKGLQEGVPVSDHRYVTRVVTLPSPFGRDLDARAAALRVPWPDVLVALIAAYLQRHTGTAEVIVGVPYMDRLGTPAARVPAMVMNVLPVRLALDEDTPLDASLKDAGKRLQIARRHGRYRGEQLRRDLGLLGDQRRLHGPLVNVLPFDRVTALPGVETTLHVLGTGPVDDLTFTIRADGAGRDVRLELDANPRIYTGADLDTHASRLARFLQRAIAAPALASVQTLTPDEWWHWTTTVNDTARDIETTTLTALIERTMRLTPHAPALTIGEETWTYGELDARTLALANRLAAHGVSRGDIVAVAMPRSRELVVALVSILRCGAAYLPIDSSHPPERIDAMLRSARPRLVLGTRAAAGAPPPTAAIWYVDDPVGDDTSRRAEPDGGAARGRSLPEPRDAAYVIYTSGSTGAPKGVVIEHRAIVNRLEWMRTQYGIASDDRILQKTPATFDVSVWEFFLPLITGATLVVAPPDAHKDPAWLASLLRAHRITTTHFVPSMLAAFLADPSARDLTMRRVFCSGEELPAALRDRFHEVVRAELHNLYGPTEAAVDVTFWPCGPDDRSVPVPIGFPVWNTQMYVLDDRLRPVAPGVAGHLYIGGVQVAREYLGRPDLTAERFVPNPFHPAEPRMYRTGDLAQWRADGALVFLGRSDHQVKIRGLRIELGEIEAALRREPAIAHAVVVAREDRPGDRRLVAYVVPRANASIAIGALRARLGDRLPDYMVPSAVVVLDALPLSRNGKLDRAALPPPARDDAPRGRPPSSATERRIAAIMADVLGTSDPASLGADDDFFQLGGHSLLAARLVARIREEWRRDISLGVVFSHPTIARLARHVDAQATAARDALGAHGLQSLIELTASTSTRPALFCIHPAGGLSWCYSGLARSLDAHRSVFGLQARGLDLEAAMPARLDDMAADYVDRMRVVQPTGPYHLVGWSIGGIIAQAMAVRLRDLGADIGVIAMLDAYPSDRWRGQADPDEHTALRALLYVAGYDPAAVPARPLSRGSVIAFLRARAHPLGELPDHALSGVLRVVEHNNRLVREHRHRRFDGSVVYFRAALDHQDDGLSPDAWAPYVESLDAHDLPLRHGDLTGPDVVRLIAPVLTARLR